MPHAPAKRPTLCAPSVVDAAIGLAGRVGVEDLSMRTLARELGVEAMSLYSHVASKSDLLGQMGAALLRRLPPARPKDAPRRRLIALAKALRDIARRHPRVFPLVVLWPLKLDAALIPVEAALDAFLQAGLRPVQAIRAQRIFLSSVRGYVMWELGGFATGRRESPTGRPRPGIAAELLATLDESAYRRTRSVAQSLCDIEPDRDFEAMLEVILGALLAPAPPAPAKPRRRAAAAPPKSARPSPRRLSP